MKTYMANHIPTTRDGMAQEQFPVDEPPEPRDPGASGYHHRMFRCLRPLPKCWAFDITFLMRETGVAL